MAFQVVLAVAAALFGVFIVWRVRPSFGRRRPTKAQRKALAEAKARVRAADGAHARALALCDAGDAYASASGPFTGVLGYYLRAMRTDPTSAEPVERASRALIRRPRSLEALLWRRLGASKWEGATRAASLAALRALRDLYSGPLRNRIRASAMSHALAAMGEPPVSEASPVAATPATAGP
jgi:hypothetical protein